MLDAAVIGVMVAPGLILLFLISFPFFVLWEWYYYGMPPFKNRSICEQLEINKRTDRRTPRERLARGASTKEVDRG